MPDEIDGLTDVFRDDVIRVVVAVRTGKNYNAVFQSSTSLLK